MTVQKKQQNMILRNMFFLMPNRDKSRGDENFERVMTVIEKGNKKE